MKVRHKTDGGGTSLDWQMCENETEWQIGQELPPTKRMAAITPSRRTRRRFVWLALLAVVLTLVSGAVGMGWYEAQVGVSKINDELEEEVAAEQWRNQHLVAAPIQQVDGRSAALHREVDPIRWLAESGELVTAVDVVDIGRDWAVVQVTVIASKGATTYQQTRVYQHTARGWSRATPTARHWGKPRQLESRHIVFDFYAQDDAAMAEGTDQYDDLYEKVYAMFFADSSSQAKLAIKIDPALMPQKILKPLALEESLVVASPAATFAPAELTASDLLLQSLALVLFDHFAAEAAASYDLSDQWQPLRDGLRLWLIWDAKLPLAVWHEPIVHWSLADPRVTAMPGMSWVPKFAHELCLDHQLWVASPLVVAVPVVCWQDAADDDNYLAWRYSYPGSETLPLPHFKTDDPSLQSDPDYIESDKHTASSVVLATVIEYVATTYGPERIPDLLVKLPQYEDMDTLIPGVFGLSLVDFEQGWHTFVVERYDLAP